jgi:Ca-activated chloride channel family protein
MDEGFEFMVTPLVFDLALNLSAPGFEIEKVYGSPEANEATGELMKVNTLFPSKTEGGETKGGIVLLKLKRVEDTENAIILSVNYKDRNGTPASVESAIVLGNETEDFYQNDGIRKGVLLARYTDFMQNWIQDERTSLDKGAPVSPAVNETSGIPVLRQAEALGQWERQSVPLNMMAEYQPLLANFATYFKAEMNKCDDETLNQEMDVLHQLVVLNEG